MGPTYGQSKEFGLGGENWSRDSILRFFDEFFFGNLEN